jgi:hypothetical protein
LVKTTGVWIVVALLVIMPWAVRNYLTFGELMFGTTTGPATLWWGSVEDKGIPLTRLQKEYRNEHPQMNEIQLSHQASKDAMYNLLHQTKKDILTKLEQRPRRLFGFPKPYDMHDPQMIVGIIYLSLGILGIVGLFTGIQGKYERLLMGLFVVTAMGLHLLTLTVFRYLMPEVPFIALGATGLVSQTGSFLKKKLKYGVQEGRLTAS